METTNNNVIAEHITIKDETIKAIVEMAKQTAAEIAKIECINFMEWAAFEGWERDNYRERWIKGYYLAPTEICPTTQALYDLYLNRPAATKY